MRIAIVEDNESVAKGIAYRLEDRGHAVDLIHDGLVADWFLRDDGNDIILLDITLPGLDGLSVLKSLRSRGDHRPVILLTARSETEDRVAGLDAGADDYVVKPFDLDELEARIRALARRRPDTVRQTLVSGPLTFDLATRRAEVDGEFLDLSRRELAVLEVLISASGRVVPKSDLLESVYGTGADVDETAIEVNVSRLRKRLRPYAIEIQVQRGLGYRLVAVS